MKEKVYYSLEAALANPEEVAQLNLGGNDLTILPAEIWQLFNLEKLDLGGNRLTSLPLEIWQLSNLMVLNLCGNQLIRLPPEIGQLSNLRRLVLSEDELTSKAKEEIRQLLPDCIVSVDYRATIA